ncbi:ATP synthase F1 subunit gamma [Candidatus Margulisiibacteriota bacterium]
MSKINEIKQRIAGVKKTKKITQALNMVAAAKFRKAHIALLKARPYSDKLKQIINDLNSRLIVKDNPFFTGRSDKAGIIVVAGDRGLCGSFNNNIFKQAEAFVRTLNTEYELVTIGTKTFQYFKNKNHPIAIKYLDFFDRLTIQDTNKVSAFILEKYLTGSWGSVHIIYNDFKSALTQKTLITKLLPVSEQIPEAPEYIADYIYEPGEEAVIDMLLKKYINFQMYRTFQESSTSEQGARMTAMEAATDNAQEMIDSFSLRYNRVRQAVITTEIAEIVGGAEALG